MVVWTDTRFAGVALVGRPHAKPNEGETVITDRIERSVVWTTRSGTEGQSASKTGNSASCVSRFDECLRVSSVVDIRVYPLDGEDIPVHHEWTQHDQDLEADLLDVAMSDVGGWIVRYQVGDS